MKMFILGLVTLTSISTFANENTWSEAGHIGGEVMTSKDLSLRDLVRNPSYQNNQQAITLAYGQFGLDPAKPYLVLSINKNGRLYCGTSTDLYKDFTNFQDLQDTTVLLPVPAESNRAHIGVVCTLSMHALIGVNKDGTPIADRAQMNLADIEEHVRAVVITPDGKTLLPSKGTRLLPLSSKIEGMSIIRIDLSSLKNQISSDLE